MSDNTTDLMFNDVVTNYQPTNPYTTVHPNHVELHVTESHVELQNIAEQRGSAWGYSVIYYLYFVTINLLHLVTAIASILVAADVFDETIDKWIVIGIAIVAAINLCLTDLMNGFEIQPKKAAFAGTIFNKPKWCQLFM